MNVSFILNQFWHNNKIYDIRKTVNSHLIVICYKILNIKQMYQSMLLTNSNKYVSVYTFKIISMMLCTYVFTWFLRKNLDGNDYLR